MVELNPHIGIDIGKTNFSIQILFVFYFSWTMGNVTAAWSLHLTKLYAALNSVLGTADRYRTLLAS